ncbi:MAG: hypothetical protein KDA90_05090 [Planctomycetaceae bacterium]|nr:hypothetical protein [Planctomycetaceae bacterium]
MIRMISTAVTSTVALCMVAVTAAANDGLPSYPTAGCGCSTSGRYYGAYAYPSQYPPAGGCATGTCGSGGYGNQFNPAPFDARGNVVTPVQGGYSPRDFNAGSSGPFYGSPSPYNDGLSRQPNVNNVPAFGSSQFFPTAPPAVQSPTIPAGMEGVAQLSPADQVAALQQRTCLVTQEPLGSMGKPIRVSVAARSTFVCCEGCISALQRNPQKYLQGASRSNAVIRR